MNATEIVLPGIVEPAGLLVRDRELPAPGPGQALVRLEASGVSFAEQQMRRGKYYDQPPFPFVPGYDLVGRVEQVGAGVDGALAGARVAAVTKTGGWATAVLVDAGHLVPVPDGVDPAEAETVVVNGVTAWQMLHRIARVGRGGTILVLGANGGVGSTLTQLARSAGIRVVGTASPRHHDTLRALGAEPIDYKDPQVYRLARDLAPDGYDAVFDHVGGPGIVESWRLVRRGGALVSYGTAATRDATGSSRLPIYGLFARLLAWNLAPNGRRAHFYNLWAGHRRRTAFQAKLRADLTKVFALLADGTLTPQVAARIPLREAAEAVRLAESGTVAGKVVLVP
ncbi:medium chain dehydrogenase/reductase family protein [Dactylosporangium sp. NPDC051541]|uniref:medium chain dehydrogenase/reductase family protein n=1 Tax=Dactylosporangium sp. NPDC051541 TaxID=3363977 RepID=UPI0037B0B432